MKHHLRSGKAKSFLLFKYIVEKMYNRAHINNEKMLLSLIIIASNINPLGKIGNNIRYLNKPHQNLVINNIQPDGIDLTEFYQYVENFIPKKLSVEFLNGLIDGDGNISVYFVIQDKTRVRVNFTIVQDTHNLSLLAEIQDFFGAGTVYTLNKNCSIFKTSSIKDLGYIILPKLIPDISTNIKKFKVEHSIPAMCSLPIIKKNKIWYTALIVFSTLNRDNLKKPEFIKLMEYSYYVSEECHVKSLTTYMKDLTKKIKYIIEDIV